MRAGRRLVSVRALKGVVVAKLEPFLNKFQTMLFEEMFVFRQYRLKMCYFFGTREYSLCSKPSILKA